MATLSHQKLRQLEWSAIGPAMIGPAWKHQMLYSDLNCSTYHERSEISGEIQCLVGATLVQKHDVRNNLGL